MAIAFLVIAFAILGTFMRWRTTYPPLHLLWSGHTQQMEITVSKIIKITRTTKPKGVFYVPVIQVCLPQVGEEDEDATMPERKNFNLEAFDGWLEEFYTTSEAAQKLRAYQTGKIITVHALDEKNGPFYARRIYFSTIRSFIMEIAVTAIFLFAILFGLRKLRENR